MYDWNYDEYGMPAARAAMVGRRITEIHTEKTGNQHVLTLDDGVEVRVVGVGDCCAWTTLHDITGLDKMVGPIVDIQPDTYVPDGVPGEDGAIDLFGYKVITDHPEFGEVTTVFAGRSSHNGYYCGWFEFLVGTPRPKECTIEIPLDSEVWCIE